MALATLAAYWHQESSRRPDLAAAGELNGRDAREILNAMAGELDRGRCFDFVMDSTRAYDG
jgi:hypothetical protein